MLEYAGIRKHNHSSERSDTFQDKLRKNICVFFYLTVDLKKEKRKKFLTFDGGQSTRDATLNVCSTCQPAAALAANSSERRANGSIRHLGVSLPNKRNAESAEYDRKVEQNESWNRNWWCARKMPASRESFERARPIIFHYLLNILK